MFLGARKCGSVFERNSLNDRLHIKPVGQILKKTRCKTKLKKKTYGLLEKTVVLIY